MLDFKLTSDGDLELSEDADISYTESVCQAVRIRLLWFLNEWRFIPELGMPYFETILVKNPSESLIRYYVREQVMSVDEVTDVTNIEINIDKKTRVATIAVTFCTDEDTFTEEVEILCPTTA